MKNIIDRIDHIVLTVTDIELTTQWYEKALGFEREFFTGPEDQPRYSLRFGQLKSNLQDKDTETPTKAKDPTRGALGPIRSVYLRDPDNNLVEVAEYV